MKNTDRLKVTNGNKWLKFQLREYKEICNSGQNRFENEYYKEKIDELQKVIYKAIEKGEIIYEN